ncbi:MAG TPA: hypothetical protein VGQ88_02325, partial [Burkholderiales bacterium]|nr:hypothetical protein [Burkholderiales bacterium]
LVLPCDLPELTAESLSEFTGAAQLARHMMLAPDAAGTGTHALLVGADWGREFCFGERSCARHHARATARGWTISIHERREFAFDLDTPRDLAAWSQAGAARRDASLLE